MAQNEALFPDAPTWQLVCFTLALFTLSLFHPAASANEASAAVETPANETSVGEAPANTEAARRDWRYDKPYVEYWTRSYECYSEQKFECAKEELAPLLDMDLTPEQKAQTRRTMAMSVNALARMAAGDRDYEAQIRHLKEAVELDPRESEVASRKHFISQAHSFLGQWSDCVRYGEESINTVIELNMDIAFYATALLAECHQKSNNYEKARHWVAESKKLVLEKEEGWDGTAWEQMISRIEDALTSPSVSN